MRLLWTLPTHGSLRDGRKISCRWEHGSTGPRSSVHQQPVQTSWLVLEGLPRVLGMNQVACEDKLVSDRDSLVDVAGKARGEQVRDDVGSRRGVGVSCKREPRRRVLLDGDVL